MQIPVDIKAVIDEATNIESARNTPISISVYMDETAPGDIQALVRQAFASASPHARVSILYFPSMPVVAAPGSDMAVVVAGLDEQIGAYVTNIRESGVPTMVVTTLPRLVCEIAEKKGYPIPKEDLLAPPVPASSHGLPPSVQESQEPWQLDGDRSASVLKKMGEWIIETCREKRLAFALAFDFVRKPLSLEAVGATSIQNAGIGLVVFIPGADMPIMTLNQAKMLLQIAAAYGEPMNLERIKELAVVVGGGFAFRALARELVAFVPVLGWAIKAGVGYAGTCAMGHAAIEYFEGGGSIVHLADVALKARDKAVKAAQGFAQQPSVKAAARKIGSKAGEVANAAAKNAVPVASSVVGSAVSAASQAGAVSDTTAQAATKLADTVTKHFKSR